MLLIGFIFTLCFTAQSLASEAASEVNWADPNLYSPPASKASTSALTPGGLDVYSVIIDSTTRTLVMSFTELESYLSKSMPMAEARKITRQLKRDPAVSTLRGVRVVDQHVELDEMKFEAGQMAETESSEPSQEKLVQKVLHLQQKKSGTP